MTVLPPSTDFTGAGVDEGDFKTAITAMRDYLNGLLNETGVVADARTALGLGTAAVLAAGTANANLPTNTNLKSTARSYSKQQGFATNGLSDGASIAWNLDNSQVASVTLGGNRTLAAPSNQIAGHTYILIVTQDGGGSKTLAYNAVYLWPSGTAPTLTTDAAAVDILTFISDGSNMFGVAQLDFS